MGLKFHSDLFKMGYFLVYKGDDGFLARQIWLEQMEEGHSEENSRFSHVECSGGGYDAINVNFPKVRIIDIRKEHGGRYAKLVRYKGLDYETKRYKVAYFSASDNGKIYAWWSLLWWKIKDWSIFRKWLKKRCLPSGIFCSYSCANALAHEYTLSKKPEYYMPADFLDERYFEIVWEGEIPKYEPNKMLQRLISWKSSLMGKTLFGLA